MKTWTITACSLALATLPFGGGCVQESANSAPAIVVATNDASPAMDEAGVPTSAPPPETAVQDLETAPAKIVSSPQPSATANLNVAAVEVAKLAQSGVDENVMLAFVTNSTHTFNLSSDQIIYLNDIGVPGDVVTAMIQHDQSLSVASAPPPQTVAPVYSNPAPVQELEPAPAPVAEAPLTPPANETANVNVTSGYFYDSLAPYGNWIEVEGYGRCWQPTVVVADRGWTPYGTRGHWVYSDCGWYWVSDYSWGWAPFHYGRWFRHNYWGWCWAPDTVWGPAWVSWRYTSGYCGWAPLPPTACYRPNIGFTYYGRPVGASFSFGLSIGAFTFVGADHFCDPHPWRYRVPHDHVTKIYSHTTIINPVVDRHDNPRLHKGIPPHEIAAVTHTEIKPVKVHDTTDIPRGHRGESIDHNRGTLTVFRPRLPETPVAGRTETRVGEGIKPANPRTAIPNLAGGDRSHGTSGQQSSGASKTSGGLRRFGDNGRVNSGVVAQQNESGRNNPQGVLQNNPANRESGAGRVQRPVPALNNHEPRNPQISRGHPEMMPQPDAQQAQRSSTTSGNPSSGSTTRSTQTHRNDLLLNRRQQQPQFNAQPQVNTPRTESQQPQRQNLQAPRMQVQPQPTPQTSPTRIQPQEQRIFRQETPRFQQPAAPPVQRQVEPRVSQQPQRSFTPAPAPAPAPAIRSQPAPAAPQIQAPQRSAPAVRQNDGGGNRQNDSGHGRGRQR